MERVSQALTQHIKRVAERYEPHATTEKSGNPRRKKVNAHWLKWDWYGNEGYKQTRNGITKRVEM
jgi:hypothetical protein